MEPINEYSHYNGFYNHFHKCDHGKGHIFYGDRIQLSKVDDSTPEKEEKLEFVTDREQKNWLEENDIAPYQYEILYIPKTEELKKKWRSTFIPDVKQKHILHKCPACTQNTLRAYDWHAFSWNLVKAQEVDKDFLSRKLKVYDKDVYLLWEECCSHGLVVKSEILRNCKWTNTDIYIFDDSFKWTFVATHEELYYYKEL
jgi:hypothetical protein